MAWPPQTPNHPPVRSRSPRGPGRSGIRQPGCLCVKYVYPGQELDALRIMFPGYMHNLKLVWSLIHWRPFRQSVTKMTFQDPPISAAKDPRRAVGNGAQYWFRWGVFGALVV